MKLYFQHSDGSESFVCETEEERYVSDALEDLHKRNPNYKTYYQRTWMDDNGWVWIDAGDHVCFYIVKEV